MSDPMDCSPPGSSVHEIVQILVHRNNQDACDQNHLEVERKTEKRKRGGGGEKQEVIEENLEKEKDEKEKKNKKRYQKKKFVSRPLMDTLWAMFKFKKNPTFQDISSLALEFSMTETQINRWFCKKGKIYKKEIHWRAYKNRRDPK
ncbi:NANOG neighbor homeobox isoform X2 [Bubalus kerabau]|uniref:NANOG neighbor homeobox isoform X2 n=1 Tax=Bubalus carabanensis TaxID=3119969 RepID=UPI00244EF850|nr:NANOG neighbor homeobox isoform X2 [Bubalus carabanensis]